MFAIKSTPLRVGIAHIDLAPDTGDPRGTSENRPMRDTSKPANECEAGQGLLYLAGGGDGNSFSTIRLASIYTGSTWAEDTAPQGCDRSAVQGPEWRGRLRPPRSAAILARMR
jgi:hypothetical protein